MKYKSKLLGKTNRAISLGAFFQRKEAVKYLNEVGWNEDTKKGFELLVVEI